MNALEAAKVAQAAIEDKLGEDIKVAIDANKIHLFDVETEKTIIN